MEKKNIRSKWKFVDSEGNNIIPYCIRVGTTNSPHRPFASLKDARAKIKSWQTELPQPIYHDAKKG